MAFVSKQGSRWAVKKGNDGKTLRTFSSRAAAQKEVKRLHRRNKPKAANRGRRAAARNKKRKKRRR